MWCTAQESLWRSGLSPLHLPGPDTTVTTRMQGGGDGAAGEALAAVIWAGGSAEVAPIAPAMELQGPGSHRSRGRLL